MMWLLKESSEELVDFFGLFGGVVDRKVET
jgi:hypothetical protein